MGVVPDRIYVINLDNTDTIVRGSELYVAGITEAQALEDLGETYSISDEVTLFEYELVAKHDVDAKTVFSIRKPKR